MDHRRQRRQVAEETVEGALGASANGTRQTGGLAPIRQFYRNKSILVTGSTGFIGKVLIEKLLHSCPEIKTIYLLIRSAQGKSPQTRLIEMIQQRPFNFRLKQDFIQSKLVAIDSDLSKSQLGLTDEQRALLQSEVSVIFHVAASVKFEAPLEVNMRHNVMATRELLEFSTKITDLACFIHVSTAYSNCQLRQIDERVYKMPVPDDPMSLEVTKEMLDKRPNTYTYTKAMAENVASQYADRLNVVIVRPSIVMSAMKEPTEGWVDTINGPVGLSVLGALGILQKIKVNSEVVFDLIPVDIVTNALVSIAWAASERKVDFSSDDNGNHLGPNATTSAAAAADQATSRVFNLTTGSENPCSFYQYFSIGREEAYKRPSTRALRPLLTIPKQKGLNPVQYWIHKMFTHLLFAYLVDFMLGLFGQKKMVVKSVNRMHHANEVFDYFCSNQWTFNTNNVKRLRQLQSEEERVIFNCDVRSIDWNAYAKVGWIGCRRFILKEPDDTASYARYRYKLICLFYYSAKVLLLIALTCLAASCIGSELVLSMCLLPVYGILYLL